MRSGFGRLFFVVSSIVLVVAPWVMAQEPPSQIRLSVPRGPAAVGQTVELKIELLGADGTPRATASGMAVAFEGAEGLLANPSLEIPAGEHSATLSIELKSPGIWQIRAKARGLRSGSGVLVAPAPGKKREVPVRRSVSQSPAPPVVTESEDVAVTDEDADSRATAVRPPRRRLREATRPDGTAGGALAGSVAESRPETDENPDGTVRLLAEPSQIHRQGQGWLPSRIEAVWLVEGAPFERESRLSIDLHLQESGGDHELTPRSLVIPEGSYNSRDLAALIANREGDVSLIAHFSGGTSDPIEIAFLPADPTKLAFPTMRDSVRGLARVASTVYVSLRSDSDEPTETEDDLEVHIQVSRPDGSNSTSKMTIRGGTYQNNAEVVFTKHGRHTLRVTAPAAANLDTDEITIVFEVAWLLIVLAVVGGLAGAGMRMLYRGSAVWPWGVLRALALGCSAAFLVLLMSDFEVLAMLGLPEHIQEALESIPASNVLGVLLFSLLAGLSFDLFFDGIAASGKRLARSGS